MCMWKFSSSLCNTINIGYIDPNSVFVSVSVCLSVCLSLSLSLSRSPARPFAFPLVCLSVRPGPRLSVRPSLRPSSRPSVCVCFSSSTFLSVTSEIVSRITTRIAIVTRHAYWCFHSQENLHSPYIRILSPNPRSVSV